MNEKILIRDINYLNNGGIYKPGSKVSLEINETGIPEIHINLKKLHFNDEKASTEFILVQEFEIWGSNDGREKEITLNSNLLDGYYILLFTTSGFHYAIDVIVNSGGNSKIAVIKPVFTRWAYHKSGFYPDRESGPKKYFNYFLDKMKICGFPLSGIQQSIRKIIFFFGINGLLRSFPSNKSINLNDFYEQNHTYAVRWNEIFGDDLIYEGLWCDEAAITYPLFKILENNKMNYDVYSDINVHKMDNCLKKYDLIIFYGQEGITSEYYNHIKDLSITCEIPMILLGIQGFAYRQYEYNSQTGDLKYLCTRGKSGMWGDNIEDREPVWGNEGELFGFQFPEPDPYWGYNQFPGHSPEYSAMRIKKTDHWLIQESGIQADSFNYMIKRKEEMLPGLTIWGGEIQKKYAKDAIVIACLGEDDDIIGIGEYRNFIIFSPTFWNLFAIYLSDVHTEVEKLIVAAIRHYT